MTVLLLVLRQYLGPAMKEKSIHFIQALERPDNLNPHHGFDDDGSCLRSCVEECLARGDPERSSGQINIMVRAVNQFNRHVFDRMSTARTDHARHLDPLFDCRDILVGQGPAQKSILKKVAASVVARGDLKFDVCILATVASCF